MVVSVKDTVVVVNVVAEMETDFIYTEENLAIGYSKNNNYNFSDDVLFKGTVEKEDENIENLKNLVYDYDETV